MKTNIEFKLFIWNIIFATKEQNIIWLQCGVIGNCASPYVPVPVLLYVYLFQLALQRQHSLRLIYNLMLNWFSSTW